MFLRAWVISQDWVLELAYWEQIYFYYLCYYNNLKNIGVACYFITGFLQL